MPVEYDNLEQLYADDFDDFSAWHHEGIGEIQAGPEGGMRLHCHGSRQGGQGCMAFFRPTLPDQIAIEYDLIVRSHGGLMLNYIAIRGLNDEDLIDDIDRLPARQGVMRDYWSKTQGLQSYHVSVSRFNDAGEHTATSNWRRNPGCLLIGHGTDPCCQIGKRYHMRLVKDAGHCQLFVDGQFAHGFIDRDASRPIPDHGKFGYRLIGSDVMMDLFAFRVYRVATDPQVWRDADDAK